jgi:hypothetical protein
MIYQSFRPLAQVVRSYSAIVLIATLGALGGCSFFGGGPVKPQPAELQPVSGAVSARQVWSSRVGKVDFPLETG